MIGAVVGLVIGLIVHAPTAPFARRRDRPPCGHRWRGHRTQHGCHLCKDAPPDQAAPLEKTPLAATCPAAPAFGLFQLAPKWFTMASRPAAKRTGTPSLGQSSSPCHLEGSQQEWLFRTTRVPWGYFCVDRASGPKISDVDAHLGEHQARRRGSETPRTLEGSPSIPSMKAEPRPRRLKPPAKLVRVRHLPHTRRFPTRSDRRIVQGCRRHARRGAQFGCR